MFRIGEFSKLTQISIRMLRYYDETGILKPAKKDPFTNYRLYETAQILELNKIIFLRDIGFSVTEIAAALSNWDDHSLASLLEQKKQAIEQTVQAELDKLSRIALASQSFQYHQNMLMDYSVSVKSIPSYHVLSLRRVVPDYFSESILWKELTDFFHEKNLPISGKTFTIYHDLDFREQNVDIELCVPVTLPLQKEGEFHFRLTEPVPYMACTMVYGPFENTTAAFHSLANWLEKHNQYRMTGRSRQMVHRGPWNNSSPDEYVTEIQMELEKINGSLAIDSHIV